MRRGSLSPCYCSQATFKELKSNCALSSPCLQGTASFNNSCRNPFKPWCFICQWSPAHSPQHSAMLVLEQESTLQSTERKMGRARETGTSQSGQGGPLGPVARQGSTALPACCERGRALPLCLSTELIALGTNAAAFNAAWHKPL